MKKLILSVSAVTGFAIASFGQGITFSDGTTAPAYDTTIAGVPNTSEDLNLELLESSSGTPSTPVATLLLSSSASPTTGLIGGTYTAAGDITSLGYILDNSGQEYNLPVGSYDLQVLAWTGAYQSYAAAEAAGVVGVFAGESGIFTATVAASPAPPADITGVGVINLTQVPTTIVPEPSTLAMAGIGLASMLIFRRRK